MKIITTLHVLLTSQFLLLGSLTVAGHNLTARMIGVPRPMSMRTCPCNAVPVIDETIDIKKVIQKFKEARPRSQRAQLVGFIKQYVTDQSEITQTVMVQASKVYSERVQSDKVYNLVKDLVKATDKQPAQAKAMLALGKVLRSFESEEPATIVPLTQLKIQIARLVSQYINDPIDSFEDQLKELAQAYCERVGSQVIYQLVMKLITTGNQEATQAKILQTLGIRAK